MGPRQLDDALSTLTDQISIQLVPLNRSTIVQVAGELDLASAPTLATALGTAMAREREVVVDLGGLDFIDCAGLHVLLEAAEAAAGPPLVLTSVPPQAQRLLELSATGDVLRVAEPRA